MQCFPRKFALTSVMKINCKMRKLCMHPEYIPSPATNQHFPGNNNPFCYKPTAVWIKASEEKKHLFF